MIVRILNTLLMLTIIVGAIFAWRARSEYEPLRSEHKRLTAKVGQLTVADETKVHVVALETDRPLDFAWQIYVPAKWDGQWEYRQKYGGSGSSSGNHPSSRMEIVRVRFRKIDGKWKMWRKMINGSGASAVRFGELYDQPELLDVRQLATDEVKIVEPDEVATLLQIFTDQPQPAKWMRKEDPATPLLIVRFGSQEAWGKLQSKGK